MEKIMLEQFMNLSKQIGELGARMEEGFKRQDEKMTAMETRLNERIDNVEEKLNAKIDNFESNLNAKIDNFESNLNAKIDRVEEKLSTKIDNVEKKINANMSQNIKDTAEMFTEVFKEIEKVGNNYE